MIRLSLVGLLLCAGCSSFFQDRVEESDKVIKQLEQQIRARALEQARLEEEIRNAAGGSAEAEGLQSQFNEMAFRLAEANQQLRAEKETRDKAMEGASDEMRWQKEMLAALLGVGATAVSALVGGAKKSVGA